MSDELIDGDIEYFKRKLEEHERKLEESMREVTETRMKLLIEAKEKNE